jgi:hypothetical protein
MTVNTRRCFKSQLLNCKLPRKRCACTHCGAWRAYLERVLEYNRFAQADRVTQVVELELMMTEDDDNESQA